MIGSSTQDSTKQHPQDAAHIQQNENDIGKKKRKQWDFIKTMNGCIVNTCSDLHAGGEKSALQMVAMSCVKHKTIASNLQKH